MLKGLKFSQGGADEVYAQGYEDLEELKDLLDEDITALCRIIRRPGGEVTVGTGAAATSKTNPGVQVSMVAETNLKLACYYLRHNLDRVSRSVIRTDVTPDNIKKLKDMKREDERYEEPKQDSYPKIDEKSWPDTFDNLNVFLRTYLGEDKIPLMYVARDTVEVTPEARDNTRYESVTDEMIARAPHVHVVGNDTIAHPTFVLNSAKVWDILETMTEGKSSRVIIKPHQRKKDGRAAYFALKQHYLGINAVNDMVTAAEAKLEGYKYRGEGRKQQFSKYVTFQKRQHNILADLERYGYKGLDDRSKVRILNKNIETDIVQTVKAQILADDKLQVDYDRCTSLYQSFINQMRSSQTKEQFNISSTRTKVKDENVEDKYYTREEYAKLSEGQKQKLWKLREERGAKKRKGDDKISRKSYDKMVRRISALEAKEAPAQDDDADESGTEEKKDESSGNRNNKALTRNAVKPKKKD